MKGRVRSLPLLYTPCFPQRCRPLPGSKIRSVLSSSLLCSVLPFPEIANLIQPLVCSGFRFPEIFNHLHPCSAQASAQASASQRLRRVPWSLHPLYGCCLISEYQPLGLTERFGSHPNHDFGTREKIACGRRKFE